MKADWRLHDLDEEEKEGYWKENVRVVEGLLGKYGSYLESQGKLGCLNISMLPRMPPQALRSPMRFHVGKLMLSKFLQPQTSTRTTCNLRDETLILSLPSLSRPGAINNFPRPLDNNSVACSGPSLPITTRIKVNIFPRFCHSRYQQLL